MWKGIDVSDNQGIIDWATVKAAGVQFAILRSVRRSGKADYQFTNNLAGCQNNGMPVSVYKYTYAMTAAAAIVEARQVVSLLHENGLKGIKVWWDVEDKSLRRLSAGQLTQCIIAAMHVIETAGYKFGIYTGEYVIRENWFRYKDFVCPYWVARYPSKSDKLLEQLPNESLRPRVPMPLWGWQHTSKGRVPGINGYVDLNVCYQDPTEEKSVEDADVIYCVSIADVWDRSAAQAVAKAYPGCVVHRAQVLDVGGIVIWIASVTDVWTETQAREALRQLKEMKVTGKIHNIRVIG